MDEAAARQWLVDAGVSRETLARIDRFVELLVEENTRQNLVSAASLDQIYARHIVDSAQLWRLAPDAASWLDLGSGTNSLDFCIGVVEGVRWRSMYTIKSRNNRCFYSLRPLRLKISG